MSYPLAQLLFLVLSNDEAWVDERLGRIAEVLSALDGGEELCRDWWKDWASRRAAAMETRLVAEKLVLQLQVDRIDAVISIVLRNSASLDGTLAELRALRARALEAQWDARDNAVRALFSRMATLAAGSQLPGASPMELSWRAAYTAQLLRDLAYPDDFALPVAPREDVDLAIEMSDDDEDPPALEAMESSGEVLSGDSEAMDSAAMESGDEA